MFGLFEKITDPVCKMEVKKKEAKFSVDFDDQKYYFCSQNCRDKFNTDPKKHATEENHTGKCCH